MGKLSYKLKINTILVSIAIVLILLIYNFVEIVLKELNVPNMEF